MIENELKKLGRRELLELLLEQTKEKEMLQKRVEEMNARLNKKDLAITNAGSIAEAALEVNGVFESAQRACEQYIENIKILSERQESISAQIEEESRMEALHIIEDARYQAKQIVDEANRKSIEIEHDTRVRCGSMINSVKQETQKYWSDVQHKIDQLMN